MQWYRRSDIDLLIGVGLAAVIAALGAFGIVSDSLVLGAVLAALALLVGGVGSLRRGITDLESRRERERNTLDRVEAIVSAGTIASAVFRLDYPDLAPSIRSSADIFIVAGLSLKTTVGAYFADLVEAVEAGGRVRILCPDPEDIHLMNQAAMASAYRSNGHEAARDVRANLDVARHLRAAAVQDNVAIRVARVLPSFGLALFVHDDLRSDAFVKLLPYAGTAGRYPVVQLKSDVDRALVDLLRSSAEALWEDCRPLD